MLIPFKSKAAADFFMLSIHAYPLLKMMGRAQTAQGVIAAADIARCLAQLQASLTALSTDEQNSTEAANLQTTSSQSFEDSFVELGVGLKQRAWPLLDMLTRAQGKHVDVVWGVTL